MSYWRLDKYNGIDSGEDHQHELNTGAIGDWINRPAEFVLCFQLKLCCCLPVISVLFTFIIWWMHYRFNFSKIFEADHKLAIVKLIFFVTINL